MKKLFTLIALACLSGITSAQISLPPNGDNQKTQLTQWIGPVSVTITYNSPNVHDPNGKDRNGHIWGELVGYGFTDQGYGWTKASPWRAGANENTTIEFSHDVKVNGADLKAGVYGFFVDVEKEGPWTLIFSNNSASWGSFFYNPAEDALRVQATPEDSRYVEFLNYGFEDRLPASTLAYLEWENKKLPFKIEVPNVNELHYEIIRNELRNDRGFDFKNWKDAALFCYTNKFHLEEGLAYAEAAVSMPGVGVKNFTTLATKSELLRANGKEAEAKTVQLEAINHPAAGVMEVHLFGRQLQNQGRKEEAFEVFKLNRKNHPDDTFVTYVGLARGYTMIGDTKNAIKNWEIAIKNVPESQKPFMKIFEGELAKLKAAI